MQQYSIISFDTVIFSSDNLSVINELMAVLNTALPENNYSIRKNTTFSNTDRILIVSDFIKNLEKEGMTLKGLIFHTRQDNNDVTCLVPMHDTEESFLMDLIRYMANNPIDSQKDYKRTIKIFDDSNLN